MIKKILILSLFIVFSSHIFADKRDDILAAVKKGGHELRKVDKSFKKDREVVLAAVKAGVYALQ